MYPPRAAFTLAVFVGLCEPSDFSGDTTTFAQCGFEIGADARTAPDTIEEGRLKDTGNTEGWGGEEDAKGRCRADEQILQTVSIRKTEGDMQ